MNPVTKVSDDGLVATLHLPRESGLALPDLEQVHTAVLNSLTSASGQRT